MARLSLALALGLAAITATAGTTSYRAHFTETRSLAGATRPLVLHGIVSFAPGKRLIWSITEPYHYRLIIARGRLTEHLPDGTSEQKPLTATPWAQALFRLFSALFGGDTGALARYFQITHTAHGLRLVPRSAALAQSVKAIRVIGTPAPRKISIEEADGSRTRLAFRTLTGAAPATSVLSPPAHQ